MFTRSISSGTSRTDLNALKLRICRLLGVDREDRSLEAVLGQVADHDVADREGVVGGADDGDRPGLEESVQHAVSPYRRSPLSSSLASGAAAAGGSPTCLTCRHEGGAQRPGELWVGRDASPPAQLARRGSPRWSGCGPPRRRSGPPRPASGSISITRVITESEGAAHDPLDRRSLAQVGEDLGLGEHRAEAADRRTASRRAARPAGPSPRASGRAAARSPRGTRRCRPRTCGSS